MLARPPYPMAALLHVKRHLIQKKLYNEGVVNIPILKLRKLRPRGGNEVTAVERVISLTLYLPTLSKFCGKGHRLLERWRSKLSFNSLLLKEEMTYST